jgi:hypothetical protein
MRTALAHIPSKEHQNRPQAIGADSDPISHLDSLGVPSSGVDENSGSQMACDDSTLDDSAQMMTNADSFGVYHVYDRKPLYDPLVHSLEPTDSRSDC